MFQSRTHTCNELRMEHVGQKVTIVGWMENVREVGNNFAFVVVRDFYGTTQVVVLRLRHPNADHQHRAVIPVVNPVCFFKTISDTLFTCSGVEVAHDRIGVTDYLREQQWPGGVKLLRQ